MSQVDWPKVTRKLYRQRWRIWAVACLAHATGLFHRAAMVPMADRIIADFDVSTTVFSSLGAVYFYIYAAMQLPAGTLPLFCFWSCMGVVILHSKRSTQFAF